MDEDVANYLPIQTEWTKEHELILVEWADKAMCYRWLHSKSHDMYNHHRLPIERKAEA